MRRMTWVVYSRMAVSRPLSAEWYSSA
jgi:hypothetical protein